MDAMPDKLAIAEKFNVFVEPRLSFQILWSSQEGFVRTATASDYFRHLREFGCYH